MVLRTMMVVHMTAEVQGNWEREQKQSSGHPQQALFHRALCVSQIRISANLSQRESRGGSKLSTPSDTAVYLIRAEPKHSTRPQ